MISRIFLSFSVKVRCIIVAGGYAGDGRNFEIIFGDFKNRQLPPLWDEFVNSSMALHDKEILLIGAAKSKREYYKLCKGFSRQNMHSLTNNDRYRSSAVTIETAIFVFGGYPSQTTYEYLPKGSTTWQRGKIPIPRGFCDGSAIAIKSGQEILLIGGFRTERRILSFNVDDHSFKESSTKLNEGRRRHRCAFIHGTNKVMITGGVDESRSVLNSTEILDTEDGSITRGSPMNTKRYGHGIGVITINNEDRLVVFGGSSDDQRDAISFEVYNNFTKKWETTDMKLKNPNLDFAYLSVRLGDILQKL